MFDVGQQKDLLRATGNSPTEPLSCRELPGSQGKAGGMGGGSSKENSHLAGGFGNHRDIHRVFILGSVDRSSSPFSPPQHCFTLRTRRNALFPNGSSLFLFHPRQYLEHLCPPPPSLRPRNQTCGKHQSRELLEKPGVPVRKAADSLPPPPGCAGAGEATRLGTSQCPAQGRTVRGGGDWVPSLAV